MTPVSEGVEGPTVMDDWPCFECGHALYLHDDGIGACVECATLVLEADRLVPACQRFKAIQ